MAKFKTETELAHRVIEWLERRDWKVYKEVAIDSKFIDLLAERSGIFWAIECKLRLSNSLLYQAFSRLPYVHYVSVAAPLIKKNFSLSIDYVPEFFLKSHGIGLLYAENGTYHSDWAGDITTDGVYEVLNPSLQNYDANNLNKIKNIITERHFTLNAGSKNEKGVEKLTPLKVTMLRVVEFLIENGPATLDEIIENINHPFDTIDIARAEIEKAMKKKGFIPVYDDDTVLKWKWIT